MRRARVIWSIVLIAAAGASLVGLLWPTRTKRPGVEQLRVSAPSRESSPAPASVARSTNGAGTAPTDAGASAEGKTSPPRDDGAPENTPKTLRVEVTVGDTVRAGVTVRVRPSDERSPAKTATTGPDGYAIFEDLKTTQFVVEAFGEGLRLGTWGKERDPDGSWRDETGVIHLRLEVGIPFDGRVLDSATELPVPGASVVVEDWFRTWEVPPLDEAGRFHVDGVQNDNVATITVAARGYVTERIDVHVDGGKARPAETVVRLRRAGAISGEVRSPDGTPVPGAKVRVVKRDQLLPGKTVRESEVPWTDDEYEYEASALHESVHDMTRDRNEDGVAHVEVLTDAMGAFRVEGIAFDAEYDATASKGGFAASSPGPWIRATLEAANPAISLVLRRSAAVTVAVSYPAAAERTGSPRVRLLVGRYHDLRSPVVEDASGVRRFNDVDPGDFVAVVEEEGFLPVIRHATAVDGEHVTLPILLEPGATVEGIVVDREGEPVADAEVNVAAAAGQRYLSTLIYLVDSRDTKSGPDGKFFVTGLRPGASLLIAEFYGDEEVLATRERLALTAPARDVRVVVTRHGTARMRLLQPDGTPFTGNAWVQVEMTPLPAEHGWSGSAIKDGKLEERRLRDGTYVFVVCPDAYAWIRRTFEIRDGATVNFGDIRLEPGITISGSVVDATGSPIAGAFLECPDVSWREPRSDAEGHFALDRFPREVVTLEISAPGYIAERVVVDPTQPGELEIRMHRPGTISGSIRAAHGKTASSPTLFLARTGTRPVVGWGYAHIGTGDTWERDWSQGGSLECDATGNFKVALPAGHWTVWWSEGEGKDRSIAEWTIEEGEARTIDIDLPEK